MSLRDRVETVVLVMMENRSFDHMLGHLSYQRLNTEVDGLQRPLRDQNNLHAGKVYPVKSLEDRTLPADPPHEWTDVATQMAYSPVTESFTMGGFVEALADSLGGDPGPSPPPMGYFRQDKVPITSFLAQNYCTCDRWFSALPSSTQPNRTLAFCGSTRIFDTKRRLISCDDILFDWLDRAGVKWRVYHDGLSFFALYPMAWNHVLGSNFVDYEYLYRDMVTEPVADAPRVVVVEPSYEDSPHFGPDHPNDNHAPLAVAWGEEFLRRTYQAITANPEKWASTVMIVYYDEHGGFWDHVPPPALAYTTKGDPAHTFESLGPRIPGIVVSPLVESGSVFHEVLDHTSVLQLLAELFTPGEPYSDDVEARRQQGIRSLSEVLTRDEPRDEIPPAPADPIRAVGMLGEAVATSPRSGMQESFELAAERLLAEEPSGALEKYPELLQWQGDLADART